MNQIETDTQTKLSQSDMGAFGWDNVDIII
jgi:hypothetical protein